MNIKKEYYKDQFFKEQLLVQRYQIIELIGSGAMGKVYRAEDKASKGSIVAVKVLTRSLDDMKMIQKFQKEATISALLSERSDNIVKVKDYGVDENQVPFYVMEFLNGENLSDFIEFHSFSLNQFFNLARQICLAMDTAHNGIFFEGEICPIIHRDIKPSNIFVTEDDQQGEIIKVLDFGIAKLMHTEKDKTDVFQGTPKYCSPEQLLGEDLDNRSDIYSLGIVFYEMLEKRLPFDLENNSIGGWYKAHTQMIPDGFKPSSKIPLDLQRLIMRCLAKSPNDRPQSVGEIIQTLDQIRRNLEKTTLPQRQPSFEDSPKEKSPNLDSLSFIEKIYFNSSWPDNKPLEKIVFPRVTPINNTIYPSLWAMLSAEDIKRRASNIRYNKFIFQSFPHPMILWITVLYNNDDGPRWLPCYLDLKTKIGQDVTRALSNEKEYHILLFSLNQPQKCQDLHSLKVMLKQRTMLKQWASVGKTLNLKDQTQVQVSKRKLKQDFESLKSDIILEIQKSHTQELHG